MCHETGVKVLLNDSPFMPTIPAELIEASDVLLVNEHEMAQLLGIDEPDDDNWSAFDWQHAADRMAEYGFKEAIVTLGGDGSVVLDTAAPEGQWIVRIAPVKVDAVGTTGCGDSFMGTVLAGWHRASACRTRQGSRHTCRPTPPPVTVPRPRMAPPRRFGRCLVDIVDSMECGLMCKHRIPWN